MSNKHFIPKGTIISGFAGIGKTTAALEYDNVIDLESSKFFFKLPDNLTIEEYEKLKGDNSRQINPNGLSEYIDAIIRAQKKYDYVLIAMFPDLIKELNDRQIDVQIVLPNINDKNYYKDRYQNRGNSDTWIKNMLTSWDSYLNPDSPDFITNGIKLKNPIKEPIILNTLCYDPQKPYQKGESLSDIIDGNMRFKPNYLIRELNKSLKDMDVKSEQHPVLKNYIIIEYLFENCENDEQSYHQIKINLTPLASTNSSYFKENDVNIIFEHVIDSSVTCDNFTPKFRTFEINSDEDISKLHDIITTLVVNDIQFTKTLKRLEFELLF